MAKSMRVNRNKRYSKKRNNNKVTNKKSARRASKRKSRRNNKRTLRGGMEENERNASAGPPTTANNAEATNVVPTGPTGPATNNSAAQVAQTANNAGATNGAPTGPTGPATNNSAAQVAQTANNKAANKAAQVEGFSNPLYAAVKDQSRKVTLKTQLTEQITAVMELLTQKYLKNEQVTDERLNDAIEAVTVTLDKLATKESLESKYQSADLFGLTTILGKLKEFIQEPSTGQALLDNVREYHNRLFFYLNAYNQETDAELEEFLKRVKDSRQVFTREEYESYSSSLPFTDKLAAADLLYGTRQAPESGSGSGSGPELRPENTLVGGTLVRVIKEGTSYRAQIVPEPKSAAA